MKKNIHSAILVVLINNTPVLEYNREKQLSAAQLESLALMDKKLAQGITLDGKFFPHPNLEQRIEFIAANLISALLNDQEVLAAASCAYIAKELPELKQIKAEEGDGNVSIELIFDRNYQNELKMKFVPLDAITRNTH